MVTVHRKTDNREFVAEYPFGPRSDAWLHGTWSDDSTVGDIKASETDITDAQLQELS